MTGFDAPNCHTVYIDKPMKGHNLMEAIARVNRVFKDKPGGLVVDYIGIANELKAALKTDTNSNGKGKPTVDPAEAFAVLDENMDKLHALMHGCDYSAFESNALAVLLPVMNHIVGLPNLGNSELDDKKRFLDLMANIHSAYTLCSTLDEAQAYLIEIAFFDHIKAALCKATSVEKTPHR